MRDIFKLMNHNDKQSSFGREIHLFEKIIQKLTEIEHKHLMNRLAGNIHGNNSYVLNEGGNIEIPIAQMDVC